MTLATRPHTELNIAVTPEEFEADLIAAQMKAASLKRVVESQGLAVRIGSSEHLKVEAWQTIGRAYHYAGKTGIVEFLRESDGTVLGVKAHADIVSIDTGLVVGGADSFCMADEQGKEGQTIAQLAGMAQTRAEARAFKQMLSWVVVLAGYSPTPAEEMASAKTTTEPKDNRYWCGQHKTKWFKRGNMKGYAHFIGATGKSCYMKDASLVADAQQASHAAYSTPSEPAAVVEDAKPPSPDFEALVRSLPKVMTIGALFEQGRMKLGYPSTRAMTDIVGEPQMLVDLDAAQYKLIEHSPVRPPEV